MPKQKQKNDGEKLQEMIDLLKFSIAIQLAKTGVKRDEIRKKLGVGKETINSMLKGVDLAD